MAFSKLKTLIRRAAARSYQTLWTHVGKVCDLFQPQECKNYFKAAGHGVNSRRNTLGQMCRQGKTAQQIGGRGRAFALTLPFRDFDGTEPAGDGQAVKNLAGLPLPIHDA